MLKDHILKTYGYDVDEPDKPKKPEVVKKGNVFQIKFKDKDKEKET
jgi:hypothetical protein